MEELLLRALLAGEKLNVVDQQDVDVAELVAEAGHLVVADRVDHLVGELLAADVADGSMRLSALHVVTDRMHQVGLAHSNAAIEEQRVVGLRGPFCDGLCCSGRELIPTPNHERIELIPRIQLRCCAPVEACLLRRRLHDTVGTHRSTQPSLPRRTLTVTWHGRKAAVLADLWDTRILFRRCKRHRFDIQPEVIDGLLDQVGIAVANMLEVSRGDPNKKLLALKM